MKYFKLILDDSNENDVVCYCEDTKGFEQYDLKEGKFVEDWNENITFHYNPKEGDRFTDYLANDLGWFIVSEKLKDAIGKLNVNGIQYLPVKIVDLKSRAYPNEYYVVNVIEVVDAINLKESVYDVFDFEGEKMYSVIKYAVTKSKINNKDLFKLKGHEIPMFISEKLKNAIEERNITGCSFLEIKSI